jgi:hypothetical protein
VSSKELMEPHVDEQVPIPTRTRIQTVETEDTSDTEIIELYKLII